MPVLIIELRLNGMRAMVWAPNVLHSEKHTFIDNRSESELTSILETDDSNDLVRSGVKRLYYPISVINPKRLDWILGYDLYSDPIRREAIVKATRSKQMAFTGPIDLVHDDNAPGILAMKAVFEPKQKEIKGVAAVVYRMDQFLQNTLTNEMEVLDVIINDESPGNALLFSSIADEVSPESEEAKQVLSMNVANRMWNISIYPKKIYSGFPHSLASYFILLLGVLTTALLVLNLKGRDERSVKLEEQVAERTKELEVSNKQKENLLREIHHRVKNNLQITSSLINLQKRKLEDEEAIYALTSSQDRINAIAMIHQKIYQHQGVDAVDLKSYLENLINSHKRISPSVQYEIDCPEVFLDLDSAVPLAIITSEIVVNSLKHAFPIDDPKNTLYLLVTQMKKDVIDIVISDNGVGFSKKSNTSKSSGLGHEIIKKLCRQLQAEYEYNSSPSGTVFSMRFKQLKLQIPVFA